MLVPAPRTPPVPGPSKPGDMYTDRATLTIWLGVDPADDPAGMVLVSDNEGTTDLINQVDTSIRADTTAALALKAPLASPVFTGNPTLAVSPAPGDNDTSIATTAFVKAAVAAGASQWVPGMIMLWSGALNQIGVGALAGWALCDGGNGTPDLRDRFIMGAGSRVPGSKNDASSATLAWSEMAGSHAHVVDAHTLIPSELPAHYHYGHGQANGALTANGSTASYPGDTQTYTGYGQRITVAAGSGAGLMWQGSQAFNTGSISAHAHTISAVPVTGYTGYQTDGTLWQAHNHTMQSAGVHQHSVSALQLREAVPYYALAYIMKL